MGSTLVSASNHGTPALVVPSPYNPTPVRYPRTATFLSDPVEYQFFKYFVDIRPARPVASTIWLKVIVPFTAFPVSDERQVYTVETGLLFWSNLGETTLSSWTPASSDKKRGREGCGRTGTGRHSMPHNFKLDNGRATVVLSNWFASPRWRSQVQLRVHNFFLNSVTFCDNFPFYG